MIPPRPAGLVAAGAAVLGLCIGLGALVGGDPLLAVELVATGLLGLWAVMLAREIGRSRRLAWALAHGSRQTSMFGVPCRLTPGLDRDAVVVGAIRPVIYVGTPLLAALSDEELRAVVLHEDHHRRTLAPIRAAALDVWLRILGRSSHLRAALSNRRSDLETLADADAIERGSSARSLARALVKGDAARRAASFGHDAERRVRQLLARANGLPIAPVGRVPYEWLPVILVPAASVGCHVAL